jgi:hypothetical protein
MIYDKAEVTENSIITNRFWREPNDVIDTLHWLLTGMDYTIDDGIVEIRNNELLSGKWQVIIDYTDDKVKLYRINNQLN